jgi:hypothetical protein
MAENVFLDPVEKVNFGVEMAQFGLEGLPFSSSLKLG